MEIKIRNLTEEETILEDMMMDMEMEPLEETETDLALVIQNPLKIRAIIVHPIIHVTRDTKLTKQITDVEMKPIFHYYYYYYY